MSDWSSEDWVELAAWTDRHEALSPRQQRFSEGFAALLMRGETPGTRHRAQAEEVWAAAAEAGFCPSNDPLEGPVLMDRIGRLIELCPRPGWFALWKDLEGEVPANDKRSFMVEVRFTGAGIDLRCLGNQHLAPALHLSTQVMAELDKMGWKGRADFRRRLYFEELNDDDAGRETAAEILYDVLSLVSPGPTYLEAPLAFAEGATIIGAKWALPEAHFGVTEG